MTTVVSVLQPKRPSADLSDITTVQITSRGYEVDPSGQEFYVIRFAADVTDDIVRLITVRLTTASNVEEVLTLQADSALSANRNFRQNVVPQLLTNATVRERAWINQLDALSKQNTMVIRLLLKMLDSDA